ncbi:MAG: dihydroxyacetone kinase subunit DhaK [Pseudomonas sp.]
MKKLINQPDRYVDEALEGMVEANPSMIRTGQGLRVIARSTPIRKGKVGVVSGGGFGHLPVFSGYVGNGLLDACAVGNVFEGPNVQSCIDAITVANGGAGVLKLFGNYGGDKMNFAMASEMLEFDGIETSTVLVTDDIASAGPDEAAKRRGVAGIIYAYKIAGAMAETGASLADVTAMAQHAVSRLRTVGVALASCQVPGADRPTFTLPEGEIELGMGIHGEPGLWRKPMVKADALVDEMVDRLLADLPATGTKVSVLVNSLGATPLEELFILFRRAKQRLASEGLELVQPLIGPYVTSMEMAGASITLFHLDEHLEELYRAPAHCPFWKVS